MKEEVGSAISVVESLCEVGGKIWEPIPATLRAVYELEAKRASAEASLAECGPSSDLNMLINDICELD